MIQDPQKNNYTEEELTARYADQEFFQKIVEKDGEKAGKAFIHALTQNVSREDMDTIAPLLATVRFVENGRPGLEYGVVDERAVDKAHEYDKTFYRTQVGWSAKTLQNKFNTWKSEGAQGDFDQYLQSKYAPIGAKNDPDKLNNNWLKNFKALKFTYSPVMQEGEVSALGGREERKEETEFVPGQDITIMGDGTPGDGADFEPGKLTGGSFRKEQAEQADILEQAKAAGDPRQILNEEDLNEYRVFQESYENEREGIVDENYEPKPYDTYTEKLLGVLTGVEGMQYVPMAPLFGGLSSDRTYNSVQSKKWALPLIGGYKHETRPVLKAALDLIKLTSPLNSLGEYENIHDVLDESLRQEIAAAHEEASKMPEEGGPLMFRDWLNGKNIPSVNIEEDVFATNLMLLDALMFKLKKDYEPLPMNPRGRERERFEDYFNSSYWRADLDAGFTLLNDYETGKLQKPLMKTDGTIIPMTNGEKDDFFDEVSAYRTFEGRNPNGEGFGFRKAIPPITNENKWRLQDGYHSQWANRFGYLTGLFDIPQPTVLGYGEEGKDYRAHIGPEMAAWMSTFMIAAAGAKGTGAGKWGQFWSSASADFVMQFANPREPNMANFLRDLGGMGAFASFWEGLAPLDRAFSESELLKNMSVSGDKDHFQRGIAASIEGILMAPVVGGVVGGSIFVAGLGMSLLGLTIKGTFLGAGKGAKFSAKTIKKIAGKFEDIELSKQDIEDAIAVYETGYGRFMNMHSGASFDSLIDSISAISGAGKKLSKVAKDKLKSLRKTSQKQMSTLSDKEAIDSFDKLNNEIDEAYFRVGEDDRVFNELLEARYELLEHMIENDIPFKLGKDTYFGRPSNHKGAGRKPLYHKYDNWNRTRMFINDLENLKKNKSAHGVVSRKNPEGLSLQSIKSKIARLREKNKVVAKSLKKGGNPNPAAWTSGTLYDFLAKKGYKDERGNKSLAQYKAEQAVAEGISDEAAMAGAIVDYGKLKRPELERVLVKEFGLKPKEAKQFKNKNEIISFIGQRQRQEAFTYQMRSGMAPSDVSGFLRKLGSVIKKDKELESILNAEEKVLQKMALAKKLKTKGMPIEETRQALIQDLVIKDLGVKDSHEVLQHLHNLADVVSSRKEYMPNYTDEMMGNEFAEIDKLIADVTDHVQKKHNVKPATIKSDDKAVQEMIASEKKALQEQGSNIEAKQIEKIKTPIEETSGPEVEGSKVIFEATDNPDNIAQKLLAIGHDKSFVKNLLMANDVDALLRLANDGPQTAQKLYFDIIQTQQKIMAELKKSRLSDKQIKKDPALRNAIKEQKRVKKHLEKSGLSTVEISQIEDNAILKIETNLDKQIEIEYKEGDIQVPDSVKVKTNEGMLVLANILNGRGLGDKYDYHSEAFGFARTQKFARKIGMVVGRQWNKSNLPELKKAIDDYIEDVAAKANAKPEGKAEVEVPKEKTLDDMNLKELREYAKNKALSSTGRSADSLREKIKAEETEVKPVEEVEVEAPVEAPKAKTKIEEEVEAAGKNKLDDDIAKKEANEEDSKLFDEDGKVDKKYLEELEDRADKVYNSFRAYKSATEADRAVKGAEFEKAVLMMQRWISKKEIIDAIESGDPLNQGFLHKSVMMRHMYAPSSKADDAMMVQWSDRSRNRAYFTAADYERFMDDFLGSKRKAGEISETETGYGDFSKQVIEMFDQQDGHKFMKKRTVLKPVLSRYGLRRVAMILKDFGNANLVSGIGTQIAASAGLFLKRPRYFTDKVYTAAIAKVGWGKTKDWARFVMDFHNEIKNDPRLDNRTVLGLTKDVLLNGIGHPIESLKSAKQKLGDWYYTRFLTPAVDNTHVSQSFDEISGKSPEFGMDDIKLEDYERIKMTPRVLGVPIAPKRNLPVVGLTQTGMAAARIKNPILRDIMLTWVASNEAMARDVMSGLIDKNTKNFGGTAHTRELLKELAAEIHSDDMFKNPQWDDMREYLFTLQEWNQGRASGEIGREVSQDDWFRKRLGLFRSQEDLTNMIKELGEDNWEELGYSEYSKEVLEGFSLDNADAMETAISRNTQVSQKLYSADESARSRMEELTLQHETDWVSKGASWISQNAGWGFVGRFGRTMANTWTMGMETTPIIGEIWHQFNVRTRGRKGTPAAQFNSIAKQTNWLAMMGMISSYVANVKEGRQFFGEDKEGNFFFMIPANMEQARESFENRFANNPEFLRRVMREHNINVEVLGAGQKYEDIHKFKTEVLWSKYQPKDGQVRITLDRAGYVYNNVKTAIKIGWAFSDYSPRFSKKELENDGFLEDIAESFGQAAMTAGNPLGTAGWAADIFRTMTDIVDVQKPLDALDTIGSLIIMDAIYPFSPVPSGLRNTINPQLSAVDGRGRSKTLRNIMSMPVLKGFDDKDPTRRDFTGMPMENPQYQGSWWNLGVGYLAKGDYENTTWEQAFNDLDIVNNPPLPERFKKGNIAGINLREYVHTVVDPKTGKKNSYNAYEYYCDTLNTYQLPSTQKANAGKLTTLPDELDAYFKDPGTQAMIKLAMEVKYWDSGQLQEDIANTPEGESTKYDLAIEALNDIDAEIESIRGRYTRALDRQIRTPFFDVNAQFRYNKHQMSWLEDVRHKDTDEPLHSDAIGVYGARGKMAQAMLEIEILKQGAGRNVPSEEQEPLEMLK